MVDNFALVVRLIVFFLAIAVGLTGVAGFGATLFFLEALAVRLFFGPAPDLAAPPRILRSSLFRVSICSLIAVARLSWVIERSNKFMASLNIQIEWKSSTGQLQTMPLAKLMVEQIAFPDGFHVSITNNEHADSFYCSANRISGNRIGQAGYSVGFILREG